MDPDNLDLLLCLRMDYNFWSAEDIEDILMKQEREESHNGTNSTEVAVENILNYYVARN